MHLWWIIVVRYQLFHLIWNNTETSYIICLKFRLSHTEDSYLTHRHAWLKYKLIKALRHNANNKGYNYLLFNISLFVEYTIFTRKTIQPILTLKTLHRKLNLFISYNQIMWNQNKISLKNQRSDLVSIET